MNTKQEQTDWSAWFSTYGLLTAERILARFNVHLPHDALIKAIKNPLSMQYTLLLVPLKNVFNGIIFQQAHDYQIYAQKLFVDYLLTGQDAKPSDAPGAMTRADLEQQRLNLIEMGEEFQQQEAAHKLLIAESQGRLIALSHDLDSGVNASSELGLVIAPFLKRAEEINVNLRSFRSQFYNFILHVTELLSLLPDYHADAAKIIENRVALEFDTLIGE